MVSSRSKVSIMAMFQGLGLSADIDCPCSILATRTLRWPSLAFGICLGRGFRDVPRPIPKSGSAVIHTLPQSWAMNHHFYWASGTLRP
ncbi:hypothetical protein DFH09DRAFT_1183483 [Mycena vulgaris]|nr:hypothetical protein DFH09DRAFT_1183483 [Mycena vulgaris]